jgi:predicted pyridoxine 5'-phosphate oxidase superfamily flavin-nucleotide-binding protein
MTVEAKSPFHAGEIEAQTRAGTASPRGAGIRDFMPDQHREFFALLPFVLVGAADENGSPAATLLTGSPGFITSPDPRTLVIAAAPAADDPFADDLRAGRQVGLLGIDLATRRRNRANGRITERNGETLTVAVEQSFGNCAQYIQARDVEHVARGADHLAQPLDRLDDNAREQIAGADTFFVATSSGARAGGLGGIDISHRGGRPGFVRIDGDTLTIPDFKGNRFFNTFGNLLLEPRAALLFVDFASGDLLHLQGRAEILWDAGDELRRLAGAERLWRFHVARGWRRPGAVPLQWRFRAFAPTTEATGLWSSTATAKAPA